MSKIIVTTGLKYTDIDGLACCIAYAELLKLQGLNASVYLPGTINQSCTAVVLKDAEGKYVTQLEPVDYESAKFVIQDLSILEYIDPKINPDQIIEVYDHHIYGGDSDWKDRPKTKVIIEEIGACATLVWREFKQRGLQNQISAASARLLYTAIISNSLYLKAAVTKQEDKQAYQELKELAFISDTYDQQYFAAVEKTIVSNVEVAIENDAKDFVLNGKTYRVIQMELWDGEKFIRENEPLIAKYIKNCKADIAFFTSPCISKGMNFLLVYDQVTKDYLKNLIGAEFIGDLGTTSKMFLRKEIKMRMHQI